MSYLPETEALQLLDEAKLASEQTHSPYSKFVVGAAVLAKNGRVYRGANIENASYGLTVCAERIALGNAITDATRDIAAVAVYGPVASISPCGACRQFIIEFGTDIVVIFSQQGQLVQKKAHELLPFHFHLPA